MRISDFDFDLPEDLIAQHPAKSRDRSRLLILNKKDGSSNHRHFFDIVEYLKPGDLLILNNSKVFPARLIGEKEVTRGQVEILLNHEIEPGLWQAIGKNLKVGNRIRFIGSKLSAAVMGKNEDVYHIRFNMIGNRLFEEVDKIGLIPLPPYIKRTLKTKDKGLKISSDRSSYQTVYAKDRGSVAAPTAGLHFTPELLKEIKERGVNIEYVTLHVGLGTFAPIKTEKVEKHQIHKEFYSIDKKVVEKIIEAKNKHQRVIAVGTTTVRTLEGVFGKIQNPKSMKAVSCKLPVSPGASRGGESESYSGWTDIYIYPGYKFKVVDAMITNFHLPKSSLLLLVSAFSGTDIIKKAYAEAIKQKYRFYSYGDAMFIY